MTDQLAHDRRICELAQTALRNSGYRALAQIDCEVVDGHVVLRGAVATFHLKQLAQVLVMRMGTVRRLENRLQVDA